MKLTFIFSTSKHFNPASWAIRKIIKAPFSHVAVRFELEGLLFVVHASKGGVRLMSYKRFQKENKIFHDYDIDLNLDQFQNGKFKETLRHYLTLRFGYLNIAGIGISNLLSLFGIKNKKIFADKDKTVFCSEFAWIVANEIGLTINDYDFEVGDPLMFHKGLKNALASK